MLIITVFLFFIGLNSWAQDRYMVFFTDKIGSPYSVQSPEDFLSERALKRRENQQIEITEQDLPISPVYRQGLKSIGAEVYFSTKWMNGCLVQMDENEAMAVQSLPYVTKVELVAPNAPLSYASEKNEDPLPGSNNLASFQQSMLAIDLMHSYGFYGEGMLIAVFDDGFQNLNQLSAFDHLFLDNRLLYTFDFVNNRVNVENGEDHGTRVLSIIAASEANYTGAAPHASFILSVTEAPLEYRIEEYNWLFAVEKADSAGVDIINTSLGYKTGFSDPSMNYADIELDGKTAVITQAANMAASKGILLVNSAGNDGDLVSAPADSPNVLAVGAITADSVLVGFSSRGSNTVDAFKPDIVAQGAGTSLITSTGNYAAQNGTSFSSPLIAGLAAGVWQAYPSKSAEELREMIKLSGNMANTPDNLYGYGIPSFARIIENERGIYSGNKPIYTAFPNPTFDHIQMSFSSEYFGQQLTIQLIRGNGSLKKEFLYIPFEARNPLQIDLPESGLYFIRVMSKSESTTRKIIKY